MKTKIILEMGCNHQGSMEIAKEMIDQAAKLNVWAVKFQKRTLSLIPVEEAEKPRSLKNSFGETYYEHRAALEFNYSQLRELKNYSEDKGLKFIVTAFDIPALVHLSDFCDYVKLPSQKFSKDKYFNKWEELQPRPKMIVSCGMHTIDKILKSEWVSNSEIFMHCNSIYPVKNPYDLNFDVIRLLSIERKGIGVGYSSHDLNIGVIANAVLCGAEYVERHFTLNKNMKGSDHSTVSSTYEDIKNLQGLLLNFETMLGNKERLSKDEQVIAERYEAWKKE